MTHQDLIDLTQHLRNERVNGMLNKSTWQRREMQKLIDRVDADYYRQLSDHCRDGFPVYLSYHEEHCLHEILGYCPVQLKRSQTPTGEPK